MDAAARLTACLRSLSRRFRLLTALRGFTALGLTALLVSLALSVYLKSYNPTPRALLVSRAVLALILAATILRALWIPFRRATLAAVISRIERRWPPFNQRLQTFVTSRPSAFLPLLADEILSLAPRNPARWFVPRRVLAFYAAALVLLASSATRAPYWVRALWGLRQPFSVELTAPSNPVARGRDLPITAKAAGFTPRSATLWVRDAASRRWRSTPMRPDGPALFRADIEAVPADVDYLVSIDGVDSATARVQTVDVPLVRNVDVAPEELTVETDRPMPNGELECACGKTLPLPATVDNRARLPLDRPAGGVYHVNVRHSGAPVRVSDDFEISTFDSWVDKRPREIVPDPRAPLPDRVPAGYETAVREYYRLINRGPPSRK
jgi:hypothetical protein